MEKITPSSFKKRLRSYSIAIIWLALLISSRQSSLHSVLKYLSPPQSSQLHSSGSVVIADVRLRSDHFFTLYCLSRFSRLKSVKRQIFYYSIRLDVWGVCNRLKMQVTFFFNLSLELRILPRSLQFLALALTVASSSLALEVHFCHLSHNNRELMSLLTNWAPLSGNMCMIILFTAARNPGI